MLMAACALIGACATPTEPRLPGDRTSSTPAPAPEPAPAAFDWPAERARITDQLGVSNDVDIRLRDNGALELVLSVADAFAQNGTEPRPALQATLNRIAPVLAEVAETEIRIYGHTDGIGSEIYNLQLSFLRAEAVMEHLRSRGVALTRLHADGKGEAEPIADNASEAGRARNRRIEIVIEPLR
jgi:outer membrane protein OmpA-like peptidoglycan-associated protein